jgi:NAD(P)-dependent dehydrogenase (short-subunit alcohol dehydrogenase family)
VARFSEMVAVVVGGADNIGRATAELLAEGGARVVVGYHSNRQGAEETLLAIRSAGGEAIAVRLDHAREEEVVALVEQTLSTFGKINILINNAANTSPAHFQRDRDTVKMDVDLWDKAMASNLRGPMLTCKHTIPHMIAAGYGSIVNTGSGAVFRGDSVRTAYSASKIALHSLTMDIATSYGCRATNRVRIERQSG